MCFVAKSCSFEQVMQLHVSCNNGSGAPLICLLVGVDRQNDFGGDSTFNLRDDSDDGDNAFTTFDI